MSEPRRMTEAQQRALLAYVRLAAEALLRGQSVPAAPLFLMTAPYSGLFVTLRAVDGRLRGCMGRMCATGPLADALVEVTRCSLNDPRFTECPVAVAELPHLCVEVSILGPLWKVDRPERLVAGVHGVLITQGLRRGCFLPQVALEQGWSIETFLGECCRLKAGLPADAWRDPATQVEAFEVYAVRDAGGSGRASAVSEDVDA